MSVAHRADLVVRVGVYPHQAQKILCYEQDQLAQIGADYRFVECRTEEQLISSVHDADAILYGGHVPMIRRVLSAMPRCKVIVICGVGVNSIDLPAATSQGILVANLPDICVDEVADHAMALILACNRKIVRLDTHVKTIGWDRSLFEPMPALRKSTLGLLAFGNIGQAVAARARPFGLHVMAYDPFVPEHVFHARSVERAELDDLLRRSDFVSCHLPLTEATRGRLGEREFRLMKPNALFINTSRGSVVDEAALVRALAEEWIAGAGLDVVVTEPPSRDCPLLAMDNVVITPHAAGYSDQVVAEMRSKAVAEVIRVLSNRPPRTIALVNTSVLNQSNLRARLGVMRQRTKE